MGHRIQDRFNQKDFNRQTKSDIRNLRNHMAWHNTQNLAAIMELTDVTNKCNANSNTVSEEVKKLHDLNDTNSKSLLGLVSKYHDLEQRLKNEVRRNNDLRKELEGYIILLFAIVVVFIIVVFVS